MAGTTQGWTLEGWPRALAAVVSMLDQPAAIVRGGQVGGEVLAHNAAWDRLTAAQAGDGHPAAEASAPQARPGTTHHQQLPLARCLGDGRDAQALADTLAAATPQDGSSELALDGRVCTARWVNLEPDAKVALVVIEGVSAPSESQSRVIALQQARIERLLIHQTLIEQEERRRLGRALHDVVAQDLARVHAAIAGQGADPMADPTALLALLDHIIEQVRTLAFELSPPVLEDLGLLAAVRWLAEHAGEHHGTPIEVADDGREPPLDSAARTVAFRVLRELVVNAAKHAPGSSILITCVTGSRRVRLIVRDDGPGFDPQAAPHEGGPEHFGLLSVREQVRGLGGTFELVSAPGQGTRATVTLPLAEESGITGKTEELERG